MHPIKQTLITLAATIALSTSALAGTLVINSDQADPAPKAAFAEVVKQFEAANPDIKVKLNTFDKEAYKTALRNWLATEPPDVVFWYAGNRMKQFVDKKLFEDVSDLWTDGDLLNKMSTAAPAMSIDKKQWGMPYTYYQWGVYYRKDIFEKLGIEIPKTYDEYLAACAKIKEAGIAPVTIGTKYLWTAAGWFDYLNMRTNGLDFHIDLMDGKIPYTDDRVKATFANWSKMVEPEYFVKDHATYSWQEALPFLLKGEAAMYLLGNFITPQFGDQKENMGFFQFPIINPEVGVGEDAPMDTVHIPAKAKNKEDARKFLAYLATPDVQTTINAAINQIPPNKDAKAADNYFLNIGIKMLSEADGTAQFYDRDTTPGMAKEGMKGFQEFMVKPERLDKILESLEKTRKREFKVK